MGGANCWRTRRSRASEMTIQQQINPLETAGRQLINAVKGGHTTIMESMLEQGVNINFQDDVSIIFTIESEICIIQKFVLGVLYAYTL